MRDMAKRLYLHRGYKRSERVVFLKLYSIVEKLPAPGLFVIPEINLVGGGSAFVITPILNLSILLNYF